MAEATDGILPSTIPWRAWSDAVIRNHQIRELTSHRVNGLNEALRIFVLDLPGSGGACHEYVVLVPSGVDEDSIHEETQFDAGHQINDIQELTLEKHGGNLAFISDFERDALYGDRLPTRNNRVYYVSQRISFQNGPVKEVGYNGNSHEALLAILLDRLESFQAGPYASHDNQMALDHIQSARLWLHKRTMDRVARGVEGTHQK